MLSDLNQNIISSFNENTDLSILTLSAGSDEYDFNTELFSVQVSFKVNQTILDSLKVQNSAGDIDFPTDLQIQCIFQNQDTFNDKFQNPIFSKTSNLNSYDTDANINIEKFSQYEILNKYYKSLQNSNYTSTAGKNIVDTTNMDFTAFSNTNNGDTASGNQSTGRGYFAETTYEYTHVIDNATSQLFLNSSYNSVRVLILDSDNNIIGDTGTRITSKSILELASQRITVDEMLYLKENNVDGFEDKIDFTLTNNNYNIAINDNSFQSLTSIFDIQVQGTVSYVNDLELNAFPFSLVYNNLSFVSETADAGWSISFNESSILDFNKFIVQHLFLSNNQEIIFEITGTLNFIRIEEGTQRQDNLTWSFTKNDVTIDNLVNTLLTVDNTTFALNNIFASLDLTHQISKNVESDIFILTVNNISNIDSLPSTDFSERTVLETIEIDEAEVSSLNRDISGDSSYTLGEISNAVITDNALRLSSLRSQESLYFSQSDSNKLGSSSFVNKITFTYAHIYNNNKYTIEYEVNNQQDISNTYLDRINNYNAVFEDFNLEFKNLIKVAIDLNNNNNNNNNEVTTTSRFGNQSFQLPSIPGQFEFQRSQSDTRSNTNVSINNNVVNTFVVNKAEILASQIQTNILNDYEYLGYDNATDVFNNIYIVLRQSNTFYIEKFSECFSVSDDSLNYKLNDDKLSKLNQSTGSSFLNTTSRIGIVNFINSSSQRNKKNTRQLLLSDRIVDIKRGLSRLENSVYSLKINVFIFPKVINDILDKGYALDNNNMLTLFSNSNIEDINTATEAAHNFINLVTENNPQNLYFQQLFEKPNDVNKRNSKYEYFNFISSLLPNIFDRANSTIKFSFSNSSGSSSSILRNISEKEQFLNINTSNLPNIRSTSSDVAPDDPIAIIPIDLTGDYLDESDRPEQDLLINIDNLRLDIVPEYNIYKDFYNLSRVNTEILLDNNPYKITFDKYIDIGDKSSEIKTYKVDNIIIYNEASRESKIKINITNLKRSFGIFGNISENDIFIRASLFPLFTSPSDFLSHYRYEKNGEPTFTLRSSSSSNAAGHKAHSWYSSQYTDNNGNAQDWPNDVTFRNSADNRPETGALSFYEGKKYFSYQRFYAKDHSGDSSASNRKFGFVENYIPQNYIKQERSLGNDYLTIDVNRNSVDLLNSLDFNDLTDDAIGIFAKDNCMLKDVILRVSVSIKVYGGSIPEYITLYLNSPIIRQNLINDKIILNNASSNSGADSTGTDARPVTKINTRHIRKDY